MILHEQANQGQTIIEKLERHGGSAGFAVVLLTEPTSTVHHSNAGDTPRRRRGVRQTSAGISVWFAWPARRWSVDPALLALPIAAQVTLEHLQPAREGDRLAPEREVQFKQPRCSGPRSGRLSGRRSPVPLTVRHGSAYDREVSSSGPRTLAETWDAHTAAEFVDRDPTAAVALMTEDATLVHVPLGIGGAGRDAVRQFYARFLTAQVPDDLALENVTRTVVPDRVVDEFIVRFTHTVQMDWLAPGIPATGRTVALPHVGIIGFRDGLICSEHIYWDHACALVQIGALESGNLPVLGAEQAGRLFAPTGSFDLHSPSR